MKVSQRIRLIFGKVLLSLSKQVEKYAFDLVQLVYLETRPNPYADLVKLNWFQRLQAIMAQQGVSEDKLARLTNIPLCKIKDYCRGLRRPNRDHRWDIGIVLVVGDDVIWGDGIEKEA